VIQRIASHQYVPGTENILLIGYEHQLPSQIVNLPSEQCRSCTETEVVLFIGSFQSRADSLIKDQALNQDGPLRAYNFRNMQ
jgi:hypothetical protein